MFEGIPVFLEWSPKGYLFQVLTLIQMPTWHYFNYDVNWCDERLQYYVEENGPGSAPHVIGNKYDRNGKVVPYRYWKAPCFSVAFEQGTVQRQCIATSTPDSVRFLLPNEQMRVSFFDEHEELAGKGGSLFSGPWMRAFLNTWATHYARIGRVVECPVCDMTFDFDTARPCEHIHWCDLCDCWSIPPVYGPEDCHHRTSDGLYYFLS